MSETDRVRDRYLFRRMLGEGASGRVWLVEDRRAPGRTLALKELVPEGTAATDRSPGESASASSADARRRRGEVLLREFATLRQLRHPNLIEVLDFEVEPDGASPRFTMEWIDGDDVVTAIARGGPDAFVELAVEALRALAFLHDFDVVHGDLKPGNLLVRRLPRLEARLVVLDFGLARVVGASSDASRAPRGTLPYMAPELFGGSVPDRASDLYALGAVLWEAVRGKPPVELRDRDLTAFAEAVASGTRRRSPLPSGYPRALSDWLEALLAPRADDRPASAAAALSALDGAFGREHALETPQTRAARLRSGPPAERAPEIARIRDSVSPDSGPRLVWLAAPPGHGKTRVLRSLETDALLSGFRVFRERALSEVDGLDRVREAATRGPTLVLVDEAELAGARLATGLARIAREPHAAPVRVVAAVRPGRMRHPAIERLWADTDTVPTVERVTLGRLDADALRLMASRATGGTVSEARVQWLADHTEGVPERAEQALVAGAWERGRATAAEPLPPSARGGRLGMLTEPARRWLRAIAALGPEATDSLVSRLADLRPLDVARATAELVATGLATHRDGRWTAESRLLAERVLDALGADARRTLAARAARIVWSARGEASDAWRLSRLWLEAGDRDRALDRARAAVGEALDAGDPAEAALRCSRALRLVHPKAPERFELRLLQADARERAGLHAAAARAYEAARKLAHDPVSELAARIGLARAFVHAEAPARALDEARGAAAIARTSAAGGSVSGAELAEIRTIEGMALARSGRELEALEVFDDALDLARTADAPDRVAAALHARGTCRLRLGRRDAREDFEAVLRADRDSRGEAGRPPGSRELKSRIALAVLHARERSWRDAATMLESVRDEAASIGDLAIEHTAISKLAAVAIDEERVDDAVRLADEAADLARHLGDRGRLIIDICRAAEADVRCGRPRRAVERLERVIERADGRVDPQHVDYARMLLAEAKLEIGDAVGFADAAALLERAVAGCRERGRRRAFLMALTIELERRARPEVSTPIEPIGVQIDALASAGDPIEPEMDVRVEIARARAALRDGRHDEAARRAATAAERAEGHGFSAFGAIACGIVAQACEAAGRGDRADAARADGRRRLDEAAARIGDPRAREDFLARRAFVPLRPAAPETASGDAELASHRLGALYDMIRMVNSTTDPDALLETILDLALRAVRAERGLILLREPDRDGEFRVRLARDLESVTIADAESYSRRIAREAGKGRSLVAIDAGSDARFRDLESVSIHGIRSLMCVPLRSRDRIVGTVYLDTRLEERAFSADDLRFVEAFADHAALALENAEARARLERENERLRVVVGERVRYAGLVGRSVSMQAVFDRIEKVADTDLPVLVLGESGTGKELVARAIHEKSARRRRPFVSENCAAIPETLLESELFGHRRGAFTGAERDRPGLFEQADGGTLFLDEVGDMSPPMQARLLRALESGEIRPVGTDRTLEVDVRVLAATHRDLEAEVEAGRFREDLLYRLRVLTVDLPPLRERPGDVELLVEHFLERIATARGREPMRVDPEALAHLERHAWPGNVRELENTLQRLAVLAGAGPIGVDDIAVDPSLRASLLGPGAGSAAFSLEAAERERIRRALEAAAGNRAKAARLLGISRATIYRKIERYDLG